MIKRMLLAWLPLLACACADDYPEYGGVEFEVQSAPPAPVSLESDRIELVAGVAVKVLVIPHSRGELEYLASDLVTLRAEDANLLEVYSTENEREFVLVGQNAGQTCLEIKINRHEEECIDVRVLPPLGE